METGEITGAASVSWFQLENTSNFAGGLGEVRPLTQTESAVIECTIAILTVIFVFGTAGNVLVCLVIAVYQQMRTVFNILVFNLALTDLLLGVLAAPTFITRLAYELWETENGTRVRESVSRILVVCHISAFTHYVCTVQSLLTMIQMSIIRAIAVLKSSKSVRFRINRIVPCALVLVNYFTSLVYSAFNYTNGTYSFCLDSRYRLSMSERLTGLGILVCELSVISITYTWMYICTKRQRAGIVARMQNEVAAGNRGGVTRPINRFDIATAKSLLLVVTAFAVSYMPYMVFISLWMVGVVEDEPRFMVIFPALTSLCSVVNPFIYAVNSSVFRRQLLKLLRLDKRVLRRTVPAIAARVQQDAPRDNIRI